MFKVNRKGKAIKHPLGLVRTRRAGLRVSFSNATAYALTTVSARDFGEKMIKI
jgi:hypothetical protein